MRRPGTTRASVRIWRGPWLVLLALAVARWTLASGLGMVARRRRSDHRSMRAVPIVWPFVSIIVPAWKENGSIQRCITSLTAIDYPCWEAIIAAGGGDGTHAAAARATHEDPRFTVIEQEARGKNAALNGGIRLARGEVVVLLDADSWVSPGWLRAMVTPLCDGAWVTTGNYAPRRRTAIALHAEAEKISECEILGRVILQGSGSIALRREALDLIGGLPEHVRVGVDWDLHVRLAGHGLRPVYCPDALVLTERPATFREWWTNETRWRRAHLASLFRSRELRRQQPLLLARHLSQYVGAWLWIALASAAVIGRWRRLTNVAGASFQGGLMLLAWHVARELSLMVGVMAFTHDSHWWRVMPVAPALVVARLAAIGVASVTVRKTSMHFKGPRPDHPPPDRERSRVL